jgi:hypothetical protein
MTDYCLFQPHRQAAGTAGDTTPRGPGVTQSKGQGRPKSCGQQEARGQGRQAFPREILRNPGPFRRRPSNLPIPPPPYGSRNTDRQLVDSRDELGVKQVASHAIVCPMGQNASARGTHRAALRQPDIRPCRIRTKTRRRQ